MNYAEKLEQLDKAYTVERVKNVILQIPPPTKPNYSDIVGCNIYGINAKKPSEIPNVIVHYLKEVIVELNFLSKTLNDPENKMQYFKSIRATLKSGNLFSGLEKRIEPAIYAMSRIEFSDNNYFARRYSALRGLAEELTVGAKNLPLVKHQPKDERLLYDKILYAESILLISELKQLCQEHIDKLKPFIKNNI